MPGRNRGGWDRGTERAYLASCRREAARLLRIEKLALAQLVRVTESNRATAGGPRRGKMQGMPVGRWFESSKPTKGKETKEMDKPNSIITSGGGGGHGGYGELDPARGWGRARREPDFYPEVALSGAWTGRIIHRVSGQVLRRVGGRWVGVRKGLGPR